jgi:hypothetical protein
MNHFAVAYIVMVVNKVVLSDYFILTSFLLRVLSSKKAKNALKELGGGNAKHSIIQL